MTPRVTYVIGGPLQPDVEARKRSGDQPRSEFNVFIERNAARLASTSDVSAGAPTSLRRRVALAATLARTSARGAALVASGEDIGLPLALATMAVRATTPLWIVMHGSYLGTRKFASLAPLLRRARHVGFLCLSQPLRDDLVETYGLPPERCCNAGYGVDTDFFTPPPEPAGTPLIVAAGSSNRDYATLVAASAGLAVPVRIAADSLWRPTGAGLDPSTLSASVEVGSAGDYGALRALYARASVVVVPLHQARFASGYAVIAEAMAMGKPVITTRTSAHSDFVLDGTTGLYTEAGDVAGLRQALELLLADPARAHAMGAAGAARMQREFSLDAYCDRIEHLIGINPRPLDAGILRHLTVPVSPADPLVAAPSISETTLSVT